MTIDGCGEVVIGNVSIPVLRVMSTETSTIAGVDFTTIYVSFDAGNFASGVYLYRLRAGDQSFTRKMTLLK